MDRPLQPRVLKMGSKSQRAGDEPLHVARPAPINAPIPKRRHKRVRTPFLPFHRHHIRVPRKHDPAIFIRRAQRSEQVRLVAIGIERQMRPRPDLVEPLVDIGDQFEIAFRRNRLKPDEIGKDFERVVEQSVSQGFSPDLFSLSLGGEGWGEGGATRSSLMASRTIPAAHWPGTRARPHR